MPQKITLLVAGQPRELSADYLKPAALEYWHAWLAYEARMAHNPFVEFAAKVQALPEDLRVVATREFVASLGFDAVPRLVLMNTARTLPAVTTLCILVTGEDVITEENSVAAFPLLLPFIQRQEIVTNSLAEANRLRAEVGKPPLGKPSPSKPSPGKSVSDEPASDKAVSNKAAVAQAFLNNLLSGQSPQGG